MALNPSSGWGYYIQLNISSITADGNLRVILKRGSGTNSISSDGKTVTIYDENHCYYSDLRDHCFGTTDNPGTATQLTEWTEKYTDGIERVVWIKLPSSSPIYLFVGNSSASAVSSETDTFFNGVADDYEPTNSFFDVVTSPWTVSTDGYISPTHGLKVPAGTGSQTDRKVYRSSTVAWPSVDFEIYNSVYVENAYTNDHTHIFALRNSRDTAWIGPHVAILSGYLQYYVTSWTTLLDYPEGQWRHFKAVIHVSTNKFDVYTSSDGTDWTSLGTNLNYHSNGTISSGTAVKVVGTCFHYPSTGSYSLRYVDNYFWVKVTSSQWSNYGDWQTLGGQIYTQTVSDYTSFVDVSNNIVGKGVQEINKFGDKIICYGKSFKSDILDILQPIQNLVLPISIEFIFSAEKFNVIGKKSISDCNILTETYNLTGKRDVTEAIKFIDILLNAPKTTILANTFLSHVLANKILSEKSDTITFFESFKNFVECVITQNILLSHIFVNLLLHSKRENLVVNEKAVYSILKKCSENILLTHILFNNIFKQEVENIFVLEGINNLTFHILKENIILSHFFASLLMSISKENLSLNERLYFLLLEQLLDNLQFFDISNQKAIITTEDVETFVDKILSGVSSFAKDNLEVDDYLYRQLINFVFEYVLLKESIIDYIFSYTVDNVVTLGYVSLNINKKLIDTLILDDFLSRLIASGLIEYCDISLLLFKSLAIQKLNSLNLLDIASFFLGYSILLEDTLSFLEQSSIKVDKYLIEQTTLSEFIQKCISLFNSENVLVFDSIIASPFILVLLSEVLGLNSYLRSRVSSTLEEPNRLFEILSSFIKVSYSDLLPLLEELEYLLPSLVIIEEYLGFNELEENVVKYNVSDYISANELLAVVQTLKRVLTENIYVSDLPIFQIASISLIPFVTYITHQKLNSILLKGKSLFDVKIGF